jgi:hypothetical protein
MRTRAKSWRRSLVLGLTAWTLTASAATDITENRQASIKTTTAHVLDVLGSSDICEKGCKYFAPQTVREIKIDHLAQLNSYYKWTHISGIKTVKFFKHVQITPGTVTKVHIRSLHREADAKLLDELEAKTKLENAPAFDASNAIFTLTPKGDQVEVKVSALTRISGLMSVFAGAARKGMKESLDAMFANFAR